MSTLPLFEDPPPELAARLGPRLRKLADDGIYIGTSSWKYEGWVGQIYTREKYITRGRFSRKRFETECIEEYAATFPIVCGDFSFYQFPSEAYWQRLFTMAGPPLLHAFKVPEDITVKRFPRHDRYGAKAGLENDAFLNAELFAEAFVRPLEPYRSRVAALIFEFGGFAREAFDDGKPFVDRLNDFLGALPRGFRYSVEIRNAELLAPEYFSCLRSHGAAHVFNAWTRMPELGAQMAMEDAYTADFTVTRALLRKGRNYEEAVAKFSPYLHAQDPNPGARQALRGLIERSKRQRQMAFLFVNNRLEGNAPESIAAIVED
ncbi:MAG: DUF72 domain-containing protein [Candidatus Solibacter usitatus]|nr:DUF72 domain-containing protein [Candidatus Solibacter usitatus]